LEKEGRLLRKSRRQAGDQLCQESGFNRHRKRHIEKAPKIRSKDTEKKQNDGREKDRDVFGVTADLEGGWGEISPKTLNDATSISNGTAWTSGEKSRKAANRSGNIE